MAAKQYKREEKRDKFTGDGKKSNFILPLAIVLIVGLGVGFYMYKGNGTGGGEATANLTSVAQNVDYTGQKIEMTQVEPVIEGGKVSINLDDVKNGSIVKFKLPNQKVVLGNGAAFNDLPLMAYVSPEGKLIAAVSLCEPCSGENFHIEGNDLVCNACGTRWELNTLKGISGGCPQYPPDQVNYSIEGSKIVMDEQALRAWTPRPLQ